MVINQTQPELHRGSERGVTRREALVRLLSGASSLAACGGALSSRYPMHSGAFGFDGTDEIKGGSRLTRDSVVTEDEAALSDEILSEVHFSLRALASRQHSDGSFGEDSELFGGDPAISALSGLAMLAWGSRPGDGGEFGVALERTVDYLLSHQYQSGLETSGGLSLPEDSNWQGAEADGLIFSATERGRKPMYGHGYATLFLAESLGETSHSGHRKGLESATELIVRVQNSEGGWRYEPKQATAADLSVTACELSALRASRNAGLYVPQGTIDSAVGYVSSLQNSDGGFRYMTLGGPSGYGRTSAAIYALQSAGQETSEAVQKGFVYLEGICSTQSQDTERQDVKAIEYWGNANFYASLAYWRDSLTAEGARRYRGYFSKFWRTARERRSADGLWHSNVSTEAETSFVLCAALTSREGSALFLR
ncbi:MAG: terpene cyclase/mutase family protein [Planctomycetia bacterium]|nr:terpene cyclase/mutase family protein [Planctomycetia bacterium]